MRSNVLTSAKLLFGWPLSLLALFFLGRIILSQKDQLLKIQTIDYTLLTVSIVCFFFYYFIRAFLWQQMLSEKGSDMPLRHSAFLWALSEVRRFIPGNIWSFLGRVMLFEQKGVAKKTTAHLLLIEVEIFLLGCIAASAFSIPFIFSTVLPPAYHNGFFINLSYGILLLILIGGIFGRKLTLLVPNNLFQRMISPVFVFDSRRMLYFTALSTFSVILFGLGTYFSMLSLTFLHPKDILGFIGFFVFSLLVGYASFITPMGLGVREAVITLGFSPLVGPSMAALLSIFSRIILIVSDLIFLLFGLIWSRTKSNIVFALERLISTHKHETILVAGILVYILYFTTASFLRFDNFYTGRFDLGNMDQTVWNTLNGRIFQFTNPDGTNIVSRLSYHADFILILLAPFYLIWSHPKMLLLIQSVVLGLGAFYIYGIGKTVLGHKNTALVFGFLYLLNPSLQFVNLYDFHPVALATTFLLGTFYYMLKQKQVFFFTFLILAALTKEQVWILVGMLSVTSIFVFKKKLTPVVFAFFGFLMFYFLLWQVIPAARGGNHFALEYLQEFGSSPTDVVTTAVTSPDRIAALLFEEKRREYIYKLFFPLGYLSFLSPHILILSAPDLAINILSNNAQLYQIYYQYTAVITPFVFIAAIYTIRTLSKFLPVFFINTIAIYLLLTTLYSTYEFGPMPWGKRANLDMFVKQLAYADSVRNSLENIPSNASAATTNNLGAHLSQRRFIYTIPNGVDNADYIVFLLTDVFAQPSLAAQKQMAQTLKSDPRFLPIFEKEEFVMFKRQWSNQSSLAL